ncbi:hypothetical protein [Micromonospora inositola]|uniref:hypothetical protein n=1 Tax=Micromonospora inositola TaxID=47865 RepID=UPI001E577B5B|nr:hypothetical protein [Micromonospora inositola]
MRAPSLCPTRNSFRGVDVRVVAERRERGLRVVDVVVEPRSPELAGAGADAPPVVPERGDAFGGEGCGEAAGDAQREAAVVAVAVQRSGSGHEQGGRVRSGPGR